MKSNNISLNLTNYRGKPLPKSVESFIQHLEQRGFKYDVSSGYAGKTINLYLKGLKCGYINPITLSYGVVGYHFAPWGRAHNDCPKEYLKNLNEEFCRRYSCNPNDLYIHTGTGSNASRKYVIILNPTIAVHVLMTDAEMSVDDDVHLVLLGNVYVEGAVRDVTMQLIERSSSARQACLNHYGYDCIICGTNLMRKYIGMLKELVHVHHEEPLAQSTGEKKFDPIAILKPVCPNCHAVIHSRKPAYSVEEVKIMLISEI